MSYDAIVVGAGISGAATAYHLRKAGAKTLLLERGEPASGGTGKSAAIIRQSYSTPLLVRLARASITMFESAKAELGRDAGFVQYGYCFVRLGRHAGRREEERRDAAAASASSTNGPRARASRAPAGDQSRGHRRHRLRAAWRLRRSGAGDRSLCRGVPGARRRIPHAHARAPPSARGRPHHRRRARRAARSAANIVVNAAGPWAKPLAASAGLDLPLRAVREQDTVWQVPAGPRGAEDLGLDGRRRDSTTARSGKAASSSGAAFRRTTSTSIPTITKPPRTMTSSADVQARVERRFPAFAGMKLIEAYAALYDVTPDWYPFVGPRSGIAGYADFSGGSGHGFKIAPSIAQGTGGLAAPPARSPTTSASSATTASRQGNLFVQSFGGNRG